MSKIDKQSTDVSVLSTTPSHLGTCIVDFRLDFNL